LRQFLTPFVDPATVDFWLRKLNPLWSWDRALARVVALQREAQDAVSLVLQPNRHFRGFAPGQHVHVSAELDGRRTTRSYSFTRPPAADGRLHITVKQVQGGRLSHYLCTQARVGDVLEVGQAFGNMTLPAPATSDLCFLAAGSGITPLMALTRAWAQAGASTRLSLLYWARTRAQMCFANELEYLHSDSPSSNCTCSPRSPTVGHPQRTLSTKPCCNTTSPIWTNAKCWRVARAALSKPPAACATRHCPSSVKASARPCGPTTPAALPMWTSP